VNNTLLVPLYQQLTWWKAASKWPGNGSSCI